LRECGLYWSTNIITEFLLDQPRDDTDWHITRWWFGGPSQFMCYHIQSSTIEFKRTRLKVCRL
jgi:hypothetical protein